MKDFETGREQTMKFAEILIILFVFLFLPGHVFPAVDTQLTLVSNTYNFPAAGTGTLIIDVEGRSDAGSVSIRVFQDAFELDNTFRPQVQSLTFSNERFTADTVFGSGPNYNVTELYHSSTGKIDYVYSYNLGNPNSIETSWTRIVTITIEYIMTNANTTLSWSNDIPDYLVTDLGNNDITGSEIPIPGSLTDLALPVQLERFTVKPGDNSVLLSWTTAGEINNAGFEIYRSVQKKGEYRKIDTYRVNPALKGAGNSTEVHHYVYSDAHVVNGITYWYKLADVDFNGSRTFLKTVSATPSRLKRSATVPGEYALHNNYPNPFNPATSIRFDIPAGKQKVVPVRLAVFDMLGRKVKTLVNEYLVPGVYTVEWDGRDESGRVLSGGIYLCGIHAGNFKRFRKMMLLK